MASAIEKYWFAVGFWHAKTDKYLPPSKEEVEYIKQLNSIDIEKEYNKGWKTANGSYTNTF